MILALAAVLLLLLAPGPAHAAVAVGPVPTNAQPLAMDGKTVLFATGTTLWRLGRTGPARRVLQAPSGILLASATHVAAWRPGLIRAGRGALDRTVVHCDESRSTRGRPSLRVALDGHHLAYLDPVCRESAERRLVVVDLDGDAEEEEADIGLDLEPGEVAISGGYALVVNRTRDRLALFNWKINGLVGEWSGEVGHAAVAADGTVVACRPGGVFARPPGRPMRRMSSRRCVGPPVALRGGAALVALRGRAGTQELVTLRPGAAPLLRARRLAVATAPVVDRGYFTAVVPTCNRRPVLLTSLVTAVRPAIDERAGPCAARVRRLERRGHAVVAELRCPAGCRGTVALQGDCAASPPARVRLAPGRAGRVRLRLGPQLADPVRRYRRVRLALELRLPGGLFRTHGLSVRGDGTRNQPDRISTLAGCEAGVR